MKDVSERLRAFVDRKYDCDWAAIRRKGADLHNQVPESTLHLL